MMNRKTYFNKAASIWDQKYNTKDLAEFLEEFVPKFGINTGENVLDAGTGTGILIPYLLKAVGSSGSITAIDYAEKMVEKCESKYSNLKNITIMLQDVENLTLPSNTFDTAVCFGLFPHIENKVKALTQLKRVLKNNGKLIIAHALSSSEIKRHHEGASTAVSGDLLPEENEMKKILNQSGFFNIYIHDKPGSYFCLSKKQL